MIALSLTLLLAEGLVAPQVQVEDQDGHRRELGGAGRPLLVIYEDQDGGKQSVRAKETLGKLNADPANQSRVDVLAVADVAKWDWWPAKKHALADIRKQAAEKKTTIWLDWTGQVRKRWDLKKAQNHLVLVGPDGKVLFASQGECDPASLERLLGKLAALGFK